MCKQTNVGGLPHALESVHIILVSKKNKRPLLFAEGVSETRRGTVSGDSRC